MKEAIPIPHAKGGAYQSPSLSAYSNGVYSSPQLFAFAKGAGVFGEAGPEAIMPLRRGPDGRLGVSAHGGSSAGFGSVVVNNYGDNRVQQRQQTETAPDGSEIKRLIIDVVADNVASGGQIGMAGKARYGWQDVTG